MVGISYWNEEDGHKLCNDIKEAYDEPGGKERYWEQVPLCFIKNIIVLKYVNVRKKILLK